MGVYENGRDGKKNEKGQKFKVVFVNVSLAEFPHAEKDKNGHGKMDPFGQYFPPKGEPPDIEHFAEKRIGSKYIAGNEVNPVMRQKHLGNTDMVN